MAHTSFGRIIGGGFLAGVVINVIEFVVNGMILGKMWEQAMQALGKTPTFSLGAIVLFNVIGFLLGIGAVWLYAAIRPRYGAGPVTAIRSGLAVWFLAYLLPNVSFYSMHLFPGRLLAIGVAVGIIEVVLATLLGAWIYKEREEAAKTAAA